MPASSRTPVTRTPVTTERQEFSRFLQDFLEHPERDMAMVFRDVPDTRPTVELFSGEAAEFQRVADLEGSPGFAGPGTTLMLIPYGQVREKGYEVSSAETAPLLAMAVSHRLNVDKSEFLARVEDQAIDFTSGDFDVSDEDYASRVRDVIDLEIGSGQGANFVIRRTFTGQIEEYDSAHAVSLFRRLLSTEEGAQWVFLIRMGGNCLVGASPERHVTLDSDGVVSMNPISGTCRFPESGPNLPDLKAFLADFKESDELYMVVDEELKMMSRICHEGPWLQGPFLREMSKLAHTEYLIRGRTHLPPARVLKESLLAPTVTGSPVENACRVIKRHEGNPRGYYSGVAALVERSASEASTIDSAILIRTADIGSTGQVRVGVGATLVRHSQPESEVLETRSKAGALLSALQRTSTSKIAGHPDIRGILEKRNATVASYWLTQQASTTAAQNRPRALIVDHEDDFTFMLASQLRTLGFDVSLKSGLEDFYTIRPELVVLGPGPGDPRDLDDARMATLRAEVRFMLAQDCPFLAVCLSHQALCLELGFPLEPLEQPNQGSQKRIPFFSRQATVAFYNTFSAYGPVGESRVRDAPERVEASACPANGEIYGLRGATFESFQFHPESLRSVDGFALLRSAVVRLVHDRRSEIIDTKLELAT